MYVSGPYVSEGYYNNEEKTKATFVVDPSGLTKNIYYKTGDCCYYNNYGEFMFLSRIDFQIKHLGYRIELGEIESNVLSLSGIMNALCLYDQPTDRIILLYTGQKKEDVLTQELSEKIPHYMVPAVVKKVSVLQTNANGKIDRKFYQSHIDELLR